MRKIVVTFNSISKIQKLKKIMKDVYTDSVNDGIKLVNFNLNKTFIPAKIEEVEMEINKVVSSNIKVVIPKSSLTFLTVAPPFDLVDGNYPIEGNYIVLPWNISTATGKNDLKALITKISTSTTSIKYTVTLNTDEDAPGSDTISNADLSLSENSFEDNTEELFERIQELENNIHLLNQNLSNANSEVNRQQHIVQQKDTQIQGLNSQINSLNSQLGNLQSTNYSQTSQINQLNGRIAQLSSNQVTWDQRVPNQTTLDLVGFTGKVIAKINPATGTFNVNVY
jgi:hypothetical protein